MGFDNHLYVGIDNFFTGQKINQLRMQQGLTAESFCNRLGVSTTSYYKRISGRSTPTPEHLLMIKELSRVPPDDLVVSWEENPKEPLTGWEERR